MPAGSSYLQALPYLALEFVKTPTKYCRKPVSELMFHLAWPFLDPMFIMLLFVAAPMMSSDGKLRAESRSLAATGFTGSAPHYIKNITKELIFVSYALEITQGRNIKNLPRLGVKSVQNYLWVAVSHATDNGQRYPRLRYNPSSLLLDINSFPNVKKLLSHMSKWADGNGKDIPLMTDILGAIEACSLSGSPSSEAACIFDKICLILQTGS